MVESLEVGPSVEADPTAAARRRKKRKGKKKKGRGKGKEKNEKGKKKEGKGEKKKGKRIKTKEKEKKTGKKRDNGKTKAGDKAQGCGTRQENACIANIVEVMNHVGTKVTNYLAQEVRQKRFRDLARKKKGKANDFEATSILLEDSKNHSSTCGPK